jgi:hypothetical protein
MCRAGYGLAHPTRSVPCNRSGDEAAKPSVALRPNAPPGAGQLMGAVIAAGPPRRRITHRLRRRPRRRARQPRCLRARIRRGVAEFALGRAHQRNREIRRAASRAMPGEPTVVLNLGSVRSKTGPPMEDVDPATGCRWAKGEAPASGSAARGRGGAQLGAIRSTCFSHRFRRNRSWDEVPSRLHA